MQEWQVLPLVRGWGLGSSRCCGRLFGLAAVGLKNINRSENGSWARATGTAKSVLFVLELLTSRNLAYRDENTSLLTPIVVALHCLQLLQIVLSSQCSNVTLVIVEL
jgi:hypothetical protein